MAAPFTTLPTTADGSAGRDKANLDAVPDLDHYIDAAEWNTVKNAVVIAAARIGLGDGTQEDTIEAALRAAEGMRLTAGQASRWLRRHDFDLGAIDGWTGSGTGSLAYEAANAVGEGHGIGNLTAVTSGNSYTIVTPQTISPLQNPSATLRIRPGGNTCQVAFALTNTGGTIYARMTGTGGGAITCAAASVAGGGSSSTATGTNLANAAWQTLRIELDLTLNAVRFYADGVLIHTITTAAAIPQAAETVGVSLIITGAAGTATALIDYIEAEGRRV